MKAYIGPMTSYLTCYDIAEKILFWKDPSDDSIDALGNWLTFGKSQPDEQTWYTGKRSMLARTLDYISSRQSRSVKISVQAYDCYDAKTSIALVAIPILEGLLAMNNSFPTKLDEGDAPAELLEESAWQHILGEMIWALREVVTPTSSDHLRVTRGLTLFGKYYEHLWD